MRGLVLVLLFFIVGFTYAKIDTLHIHYFSKGKVSSIITMNQLKVGKAFAYNKKGKLIYEREVSRIYGSTMVHFTHHNNGVIKSALYTSRPDTGIQGYSTQSFFSKKGKFIKETKESHDLFSTGNPIEPTGKKNTPEVMICASVHENTISFVNHTNQAIMLSMKNSREGREVQLSAGQIYEGPSYITAEVKGDLKNHMRFTYTGSQPSTKIQSLVEELSIHPHKTKHIVHLFESSR